MFGHNQSGKYLIGSLGRGCETHQLVEQLLYPAFESCLSIIVHSYRLVIGPYERNNYV